MKLKNIQKYYIGKLDQVEEEPRKLALPNLKALDFDKTQLVNVIFYTSTNLNPVDEKTGLVSYKMKPAFV